MSLLSLSLILFLIMDPFGNISSYLYMVEGIPPKRKAWIVIREMLIALAFMLVFYFLGEKLFEILDIDDTTVRFTSAVILFLTAIKILFPTTDSLRANLPKGEPYVVPLAVPLIAGPSLLATIMLFAHLEHSRPYMLEAIFISWFFATLVLLLAPFLKRLLTDNGLMAFERLMGMILVMMAIQRFLEGIKRFIECHLNC